MDYEIIVIGVSLGGLDALNRILSKLKPDYPLPIVIVQHRKKDSGNRLCEILNKYCKLKVQSSEDKQKIIAGNVYIAPPDYHLLVENKYLSLSIDEPVNNSRPSIDVLFESAADSYKERVIGIILTGASDDGRRGSQKIKEQGGMLIVQDPKTAKSKILPESVINTTKVDYILPLKDIGVYLSSKVVFQGRNKTYKKKEKRLDL